MHFKNISDEDFNIVNSIVAKTNYNGSLFSRIYLKAWRFFNYSTMQFAYENDIGYIRFKPTDNALQDDFFKENKPKYLYLPPLCTSDKYSEAFDNMITQSKLDEDVLIVDGLSQDYISSLDGKGLEIVYNRDYSEYLYDPNDLIEFSGKKYHSKRNHIAKFDKLYKYEFKKYSKENLEDLINLLRGWVDKQPAEYVEDDFSDEYYASKLEIDSIGIEENLEAYCLYVGDELAGFSLVEFTPSNVAIEHIEKANTKFEGVYSKLVNLVAKAAFSKARLVNRQEDMGDEGLRLSKLSYKPIGFCENYLAKNF